MNTLISRFSRQLSEAMAIGEKAVLSLPKAPIRNVLITGLGGSGIGGTIVSQLVSQEAKVPIALNKDYVLPSFVDASTLVIVSSYSGNTEETLGAMEQAMQKSAKIVCVSSGGKTIDLARQHGFDHVLIPGGMPPRSCLGYSFVQQFYILHFFGIIGNNFKQQLQSAIRLLDAKEEQIKEKAKTVAEKLAGKLPVIYSAAHFEGVAIRFRQQVNENAKMLCWHHVLPEMNHNELVGWTQKNDHLAVLIFRNENDYVRTQTRMEITKEIVSRYTPHIIEVCSEGASDIERAIYLIHVGDWISWYLSEIKKVDAMEVKVIDFLKNELAKV